METRGGKWGSSLRRAGGSGSDLETGSARQLRACLEHLRKLRQGQGVPSPYPCPSCGVRSLFWQFRSHSCIFFLLFYIHAYNTRRQQLVVCDRKYKWSFWKGARKDPLHVFTVTAAICCSAERGCGCPGRVLWFCALSHPSETVTRFFLSHGNVPNVLKWKNSECFTEHILYIPEQKYFFIVNNIFS